MADMIHVAVDDERIQRALDRLNMFTSGKARPVMSSLARYIKTSIQLRFREQKDVEGKPWKPSKRVELHGGQTLRLHGHLANSFEPESDDRSATVSTNIPYAAAHNFGVDKRVTVRGHRSGRNTSNKNRGTISVKSFEVRSFTRHQFTPKRSFMGFNEDDKVEILEILTDAIKERGG